MDDDARPATDGSAGWTCPDCGLENPSGLTCDGCGVARSWHEDPPLDLPPAPGWFGRPDAYLALLHAGAALAGLALWMRPETAPFLALGEPWQAIQVAVSTGATVAAVNRTTITRLFHQVRLEMPAHAPSDREFDVELVLVPYHHIAKASVTVELLENTYQRTLGKSSDVALRSRRLARHRLRRDAPLAGRRVTHLQTSLLAPLPNPHVHDVTAELQASLFAALAWLVPGLGEAARNLREHGGVRVRATLRVGPFRQVIERRIIVYLRSGDTVLAG